MRDAEARLTIGVAAARSGDVETASRLRIEAPEMAYDRGRERPRRERLPCALREVAHNYQASA